MLHPERRRRNRVMLEREKVLTGLKICKEFDGEKCPECPYFFEKECLSVVAGDALKLINSLYAAYQGAKNLLEQKTELMQDAIDMYQALETTYNEMRSETTTVKYALDILRMNGWKEDRLHEFLTL